MQKVVEFLQKNPVQYLATVGRDGKCYSAFYLIPEPFHFQQINQSPGIKKYDCIPVTFFDTGTFYVILDSVPLKKTGPLLSRAPILSLIHTHRAMPLHVLQDYDNGSL